MYFGFYDLRLILGASLSTPGISFQTTVAEIWSALPILFDFLKKALCVPWPINNNLELEASYLQQTPVIFHWAAGHSLTPIRPLGWSNSGVSKLQPAGQMRPAKPFHPAREAILSMIKNNIQYTYEKFVDLVEYNIFRNNHIA